MTVQQKQWFAARTREKQELSIRKFIEKLKKEENLDVDYFLPTRTVVVQLKYRKKSKEVPVIRNLFFIHATKKTACELSNVYSVPLYYMTDFSTRSMLVVPQKQMEDFIYVMDLDPEGVRISNDPLVVGQKVRVMKGHFSGIEGEIFEEPHKTYVVIHITGVLTASIRVPKSYLKIIE